MEGTNYDVVIIGAGQAGIPLAFALAKAGQRVALVERKHLGGSCVNFGCTPTKAAIASAKVAHQARRAVDYGLHIPSVEVNFPAVLGRAKRIAMQSRTTLEQRFENSDNPKLLRGHAGIDGRDGQNFRVRVGDILVTTRQIVLNAGTRSFIPAIDGLKQTDIIHAGNWHEQTELPKHLAIIGGGYIGLEMAQFYQRMGSQVTVIEDGPHIASHEDEDTAFTIQGLLEKEGIEFRLNAQVQCLQSWDNSITLTLNLGENLNELAVTHLFIATGRVPNTDDLGLETVGVKVTQRGIIEANKSLATNVEGIWVAGDIRGGPMFTHTSWDDYRILESQLIGDKSRTTDRLVPYAMFTDPELGRVGLTEREARRTFKEVKVAKFEIENNSKAREIGESNGFIKVVVDGNTDRIIGAAVMAIEGAELVHMLIDLMNVDAPYTTIRDAVHIHPTLAEAVQSATAKIG
ncbi:mercuric reductase [Chroococcidiopsis sp.]|uniref:mercuric reductase n=1 Tax=Chroococcidiopsis sp. TaxID=3088168 RepID=UPI003F2D72B0